MKFKIFLLAFFISIFAFTGTPKAIFISDTYKQGIYNISETNAFNATAKLITVPPATLLIIDSNGDQKFFKKFDNLDEIINLGFIRDGDLIVVVGKGEIAISKT